MGEEVPHDPLHKFRRQAQGLAAWFGHEVDLVRLDGMIAADMAKGERFTLSGIEREIRQGSPNAENRKAGHMESYAERIMQKAWAATESAVAAGTNKSRSGNCSEGVMGRV